MNAVAAVILDLSPDDATLRWRDAQGKAHARVLPIGPERLTRQHRFGRPASPLALEAAIETVEDAVMPLAAQLPRPAELWLGAGTGALAAGIGAAGDVLDIDTVEAAFARLADLALGRPAAQAGVPDDAGFAAALLVLREAMHHLGLRNARLGTPPAA